MALRLCFAAPAVVVAARLCQLGTADLPDPLRKTRDTCGVTLDVRSRAQPAGRRPTTNARTAELQEALNVQIKKKVKHADTKSRVQSNRVTQRTLTHLMQPRGHCALRQSNSALKMQKLGELKRQKRHWEAGFFSARLRHPVQGVLLVDTTGLLGLAV